MALEREKTFANAERLLKQGKVSQALDECRRLAEDAPKDLLMLNRLGDLLARSSRGAEAIVYYEKIADQFSTSGFYPKAIAILKKVVKVDPTRLDAIVRLGELNLKQKHSGEARSWLLQAAEAYLRARDFKHAREVYEKLVAAEPDNFVHAVRLAEARAAGGDSEQAGRELVALGGRMLLAGRIDDAERTFKRAAELLPGRAEPLAGLARCLAAAGRRDDALHAGDEAWGRSGAEAIASEILLLFEQAGDERRSTGLLADAKSDGIDDDALEQVFRAALGRGAIEDLWSRALPLFDRWTRARRFDRVAQALERLARIEDGGHLRALEQLVEMRKAEGNKPQAARAIERLVRAYQSKGEQARIDPLLETLRLFDPSSPALFLGRPTADAPAAAPPRPQAPPVAAPPAGAPAAAQPAAASVAVPVSFEAPAVPLGPADEEFVSGHLTEAEVFEKYGLHNEALQQLRQVTERFPGHVGAQEKLAGVLRTRPDRGELRAGLVALALAKRAAGDSEGARRVAKEAAELGGIEPRLRSVLERLALLAPAPATPPAAPPAPARSAPPAPAAAAPATARPSPARAPAAPPPPAATARKVETDDDLEILFDDADEAAVAADAGDGTLEEIEFYITQGMVVDALARIAEARKAGASGPALDTLEARARAAAPAEAIGAGEDKLDEDDLSTIAAALDAEFGTDRPAEAIVPAADPDAEESVDEVFAAFKEHVRAEVATEDFRTHYDLGIAYKEMGLVDDALSEFRIASESPELFRESCSMLGLCHWERGEADEAIRWYRTALQAPGEEETPLSGLRYDLAEILLQTGDPEGALELLVLVLREEPQYRDVQSRVVALREQLGL
ncbi:MAG TPA: tetratricopeptide repeat protein [Candidatus Polarisedimenticolaceae bacterium]|nr:tetratricopeptide repeat protein [Candidatus Polarisedimenticolaceae bacterium]